MTESDLSTEMIEQVYSYIDLNQGQNLSVQGFIKHLQESYGE